MLMSGCFSSVSQVYRKRDRLDPGGDNRCDGAEHDRGCPTSLAGGDCSFVAGEIAASQKIEPVSYAPSSGRDYSPFGAPTSVRVRGGHAARNMIEDALRPSLAAIAASSQGR